MYCLLMHHLIYNKHYEEIKGIKRWIGVEEDNGIDTGFCSLDYYIELHYPSLLTENQIKYRTPGDAGFIEDKSISIPLKKAKKQIKLLHYKDAMKNKFL